MSEEIKKEAPLANKAVDKALERITAERGYQNTRWGIEHDKEHTKEEWALILSVYAGKVSAETQPFSPGTDKASADAFLKRVTQLGAICLAILEAAELNSEKAQPEAKKEPEQAADSPQTK